MISCLRRAGVEVAERHVPVWEGREHKYTAGVGAALRLTAAELKLRRRVEEEFDAVVVGYPGHLDLGAARRVAKGRPVVFNPLVSVSDTLVADRGRFRAGSLAERGLRWIDRRALDSADLVVSDTEANADLFRSLGARRVEACFVGEEDPTEPVPGNPRLRQMPLRRLNTFFLSPDDPVALHRDEMDLKFRHVPSE